MQGSKPSQATRKKGMVKEGKLDKYGRANQNTPKEWTASYVDHKYVDLCLILMGGRLYDFDWWEDA